ncbi:putative bifunctional diguanylate cyclase/phosphodiesterase [Shewanella gelidii]|uniref:EAL domain-containing protein n=1 Tax=Shewanella gelidii TaxID=1642821 RepID=A0A917JLB0_9GAMM|nr:EAL domain-containing protein [Shewanella gelidii]MCL1096659.1 EAL domain-containing protein [Shewanella gelidii]GGI69307.1 hypothetical protein GCM10009332_02940 [Shewanella gelidii]
MKQLFSLNTISKKLLFILMSVAIVSTAMVASVFSAYELSTAKREQVASLNTLGEMLAANITAAVLFDDQDAIQELINPILLRSDVVSVSVTGPQGNTLAIAAQGSNSDAQVAQDPTETVLITTVLSLEGQDYGFLRIQADDSYVKEHVAFYSQFLLLLLFVTFGVSFFLSLLLRKRFLNPLLHLASVAENVTTSNDYSLRAQELSQDEIADLTSCFNGMLHTIEQRDKLLESQVKERTEELEAANVQLHEYAYKDGLTHLPNRRFFYEKLQSLIDTKDMKFALIFLDLDGFKEVNDTLGHDYGDLLLKKVAKRLTRCVRSKDTVARLGGDEFTLIIEGICEQGRACQIAEVVKTSLMQRFMIKNEEIYVTGSIGLTFFPSDGTTVDSLVKHADQAMYLSKNKGRNRYEFFSYLMEDEALEKRRLIEDLRIAIREEQFELYYQPIFSLDGQCAAKAEALIRWNHPKRGLVSPGEFIEVAESSGLIGLIGDWVRKQAISDAATWYEKTGHVVQISVNTSPLQIDQGGNWANAWIEQTAAKDLPPQAILLEVTENTLMDLSSPIQEQIERLSQHGINIAIDDFGVGYSSLAYLQKLDIDVLKIDRSFIQDLQTNESSVALIRAIITMAHNLEVLVVAEGVETEVQQQLLQQLACDYLQGFLFAKPMPAQAFYESYVEGAPVKTKRISG